MILEALKPREALEAGLVHRLVRDKDLVAEASATAARLARRAPISIAGAKRAVREGSQRSLPDGLAIERKWFLAAASRPASQRAMRAYVERVEAGGAVVGRRRASRGARNGRRPDVGVVGLSRRAAAAAPPA